jgi:hypothetical protein
MPRIGKGLGVVGQLLKTVINTEVENACEASQRGVD